MKIDQLKSLIKKGESESLEFKTSTGSISAGMQTVCAFLNSKNGGTIIFGVRDDGEIVGQDVTDKTRKDIAAELKKLEPYPTSKEVNVEYLSVKDKKFVIVIRTESEENAPYTCDGRAFTRAQSTTTRMLKDEYQYIHNEKNPTLWEELTNNNCTVQDLDKNKIKEIIRMAVHVKRLPESEMLLSIPAILNKLSLISADGKLKNAAVILFCKKESKQFMQSQIKLARFQGFDKKAFVDNKIYKGNAFDLYDKAMDFLVFGIPLAAYIESGKSERTEIPAIPYEVLREALTNALVHRDYSYAGGSAEVALYSDRLIISNMGSLPRNLSVDDLSKNHRSIPRNPLIAHVFYLCGKIEKWGRGTVDMIKESKKAGNPSPMYDASGGSFSVTLPFKEPIQTITEHQVKQSDKQSIQLTKRQKKILSILQNGPLAKEIIMKILKTTITSRAMTKELAKLRSLGLIGYKGSARAIVWFSVE